MPHSVASSSKVLAFFTGVSSLDSSSRSASQVSNCQRRLAMAGLFRNLSAMAAQLSRLPMAQEISLGCRLMQGVMP